MTNLILYKTDEGISVVADLEGNVIFNSGFFDPFEESTLNEFVNENEKDRFDEYGNVVDIRTKFFPGEEVCLDLKGKEELVLESLKITSAREISKSQYQEAVRQLKEYQRRQQEEISKIKLNYANAMDPHLEALVRLRNAEQEEIKKVEGVPKLEDLLGATQ